MGGECSAVLAQPTGCIHGSHGHNNNNALGVPYRRGQGCLEACEEAPCGRVAAKPMGEDEDDATVLALQSTAHPLLFHEPPEGTPRTPRGPAPPWAVATCSRPVDRTCTGVTPPSSLPRLLHTFPGLPEEPAAPSSAFAAELFQAVRCDSVDSLVALLQRACESGGVALFSTGDTCAPERADEALALFLSRVRSQRNASSSSETLIGAAAASGNVELTRLLLEARADPAVTDSLGCSALHRAAEGGNLEAVLLVLDRMQAAVRGINVATLTNCEGETPEMIAAVAGACEVCRAFELFSDVQDDAGLRLVGLELAVVDLAAEPTSGEGALACALLRLSALGGKLVREPFARPPAPRDEQRQWLAQACAGLQRAEQLLLSTAWEALSADAAPWQVDAVQRFLRTAELRSAWQRLRGATSCPEDFWQTHLSVESMAAACERCEDDGSELLLMALWLYTREAWPFHLLEALAALLAAPQRAAEGTTGATPLQPLQQVTDVAEALAPTAQMVQSTLLHFEELGVRHCGTTYRPVLMPTPTLRRLLERMTKPAVDGREDSLLGQGVWLALGGGGFFRAMSSRAEATRRLSQSRCNVLLCVRPDEWAPCFPKRLCLRGGCSDDVLFPHGALFRATRANRTVSSDLDPQSESRWPVVMIELAASSRFLETLEVLDVRGELAEGELESSLLDWVHGAAQDDEHRRLFAAGELLAHCGRLERAASLMGQSAFLSEGRGDKLCAARTFLACARCRAAAAASAAAANPPAKATDAARQAAAAAGQAVKLFVQALGEEHEETLAAKEAASNMGVVAV